MTDAFPRSTLNADDVKSSGPRTLTITSVESVTFGEGKDADTKPVMKFREIEQGVPLNKTRWNMCEEIFGSDDSDDWISKRITVFPTRVQYGPKMVNAIGVREPSKDDKPSDDVPF